MNDRVAAALRWASDTRELRLGDGVIAETADVFRRCFGDRPAVVVADLNTFEVAGRRVLDLFSAAGLPAREPFIFEDRHLHACYWHVEGLRRTLAERDVVPIAVGAGTINDLTKLAAHECSRPYMVVATAASMDGYTSFGASITRDGLKQNFLCPAPRAVIADIEVISQAPGELNAAGYGDLVAKLPAGADWLLADALGLEPLDARAFALVQDNLREWAGNPEGIRQGRRAAIRNLTEALLVTGFAMQYCRSSRPASGAEHHFSHLWDMQDHHHHGRIPLHGCKVAIGTVASTLLYEALLDGPIEAMDIELLSARWMSLEEIDDLVDRTHQQAGLRKLAREEMHAKYIDREALRLRLRQVRDLWPGLRERVRSQLIPCQELRQMLRAAGAPDHPAQIGIDRKRLRRSYVEAHQTRRRYTILDLAHETGLLSSCLDELAETNSFFHLNADAE